MNSISKFEQNGATYLTHQFKIGKTVWEVMIVTGRYNYVTVRKVTANPFGLLGTQFKNFDEAARHYKNPTMKLELLKIETGMV